MIAPAQTFLPIRCELRRPTADLACARALLDLHENEIKALADSGAFPTWNISRLVAPKSDEGGIRSERRFLTRALRDFAESRPITRDDDLIERLLYGKQRPFILGKHFGQAWNCDSGHVINLIEDRVLQLVKGTDYSRGRGCTPCITWASAMAFLKERRIS